MVMPDDTWTDELELGRPLPDGFQSAADHTGRHTPEPAPTLIDGILRRGHRMLITGEPKIGKSWFAIDLAWSIVTGGKLLDRFQCERGRVVYVNAKLDEREFWERVERVADMREIPLAPENHAPFRTFHTRGQGMDMEMVAAELICGFQGFDVAAVIIDPIYKLMGNENDPAAVRAVDKWTTEIACALDCAVVCVHYSEHGSPALTDMADRVCGSPLLPMCFDAHVDLAKSARYRMRGGRRRVTGGVRHALLPRAARHDPPARGSRLRPKEGGCGILTRITEGERSEVAENLRSLTIGRSIQYKEQFFDELAEVVVGFEDYHDFYVVLEKLADLIDPTDETCEAELTDVLKVHETVREYECSKCGMSWETVWAYDYGYCPYCGRRIEYADE